MGIRELDQAPTQRALLGPTNTGKTHRAVRRMLARRSGMIGLPLRLLAREVYDKVVAEVGAEQVALVTGEEKRVPRKPRYWVCTVEAMPVDHPVEFVAIDEIQLCAHRERGHVFTERLLNARGRVETWFLGADTMAPLVEALVPTAEIVRRPRFSDLRHTGPDDLSDLPPRTAVVAFSVQQVYAVAERLRRRRGGAAVVLGALSPRARNAQVAMYQAGDVHYLVATDAIGMGLNMDIDHVAFAAVRKYDGRQVRDLSAAELAQVAGRAGRYRNDGTFGTLSEVGPIDPEMVLRIENHQFEPVRSAWWRNADLCFDSLDALEESLRVSPPSRLLHGAPLAEDARTLLRLGAAPEVRRRSRDPDHVRVLWDVCRVPDFRKLLVDAHAQLLTELYLQLTGPRGALDPDGVEERLARLDRDDGDIDTLTTRLAFVRTWTYISHQKGWLDDPERWQARTRGIEDKLSDALHLKLTARFVDHRPAVGALRRARARARLAADESAPIQPDSPFAALLALDLPGRAEERRAAEPDPVALAAAAARVEGLLGAPFAAIELQVDGTISFAGAPTGRLAVGPDLLRPEVEVTDPVVAGRGPRHAVYTRLLAWSRDLVEALLEPLRRPAATGLSGAGRGLVYLLERGLGSVPRAEATDQVDGLTAADRRALARMDVRLGQRTVYVARLVKPAAVCWRAGLLRAARDGPPTLPMPPPGAASVPLAAGVPRAWYAGLGYPTLGPRAVRADQLERSLAHLRHLSRRGPFDPPDELMSWLGCSRADRDAMVEAAGYARRGEQWVDPARRRGRRR